MAITEDNRAAVAAAIKQRRERRFGTKKAAYIAAGVNSQTWDKAEDPELVESVRADILRNIIKAVAPETEGDWWELVGDGMQDLLREHVRHVNAPGATVEAGITNEDLLREIVRSRAEFDQIRAEVRGDIESLSERVARLEQRGS